MSDILDRIVATKRLEVARDTQKISLAQQRNKAESNNQDALMQPRGFVAAIEKKIANGKSGRTFSPLKLRKVMPLTAQLVFLF